MNQTNAQNINEYEDLTRYADENFDTNEVDLFQFAGVDSSPLTRLKSVILSLDWDITDDYLQELAEELASLAPHWEDDKVANLYLQGMGKIGKYLRLRGAHAHPNAIKLLLSYFYDFEQIVSAPDMSGERINKLVQNDVRKFKVLQYQIKLAEESETETAKGLEGTRETGKAGEALRQFKAAMLELDWEVTDESLNRFIEALKTLGEAETGNKAALLLIHGMQALGQYIAEERAHAHPDVFNLLHAFRDGVEQILDKGPNALDQQQKKNILVDRINRLNHLKSLIAPPDAQAAAAAPEQDNIPAPPVVETKSPEPAAVQPEPGPALREEEAPAASFTPGPTDDEDEEEELGSFIGDGPASMSGPAALSPVDDDEDDPGPIAMGDGPASISDGPAALSPVDDDEDDGLILSEDNLGPVAALTPADDETPGMDIDDLDALPEFEETAKPASDPNVFELDAVPRQTAVATAQEEYDGPFEVVDETDGALSFDVDGLPTHSMKLSEDEEALRDYAQGPRQNAAGHESWAQEEGQFSLFDEHGESHDDLDLDREQVPLAVDVPQNQAADDGLGGILDDSTAPVIAFDDTLDESEILNLEDMDEEAPVVSDAGALSSPGDTAALEEELDDIFSSNPAKSAMMTSDEKYPDEELPGPAVHSVDDASDIFRDSTVGDAHSVSPALNGVGEEEGLPGAEAALSPDDDMQAELTDKLDDFFKFDDDDGPVEAPPPQSEAVATPVAAPVDDDDEDEKALFAPTTKDDVLPSALSGVDVPQDDEVIAQDDAELTSKLDGFFGTSDEEAPAPPVETAVAGGEDDLFVVEEQPGPASTAAEPVSALSDADRPEDGSLFAEEDQELNAELDDFFVTPADQAGHAEAATDALLAETSVSPVDSSTGSALDDADVSADSALMTEEDKELEADLDNFFNLSSDDAGEQETPVAPSVEQTPVGEESLFDDATDIFADETPAVTPAQTSDAASMSALDAEEAPTDGALFAEEDKELDADLDAFFNQPDEAEQETLAVPSADQVAEESVAPLFVDTPTAEPEQAAAAPDETGLFAEEELTLSDDVPLDVQTETSTVAEEVSVAPVVDAQETLSFDDSATLSTPDEEASLELQFDDAEDGLVGTASGPIVADSGEEEEGAVLQQDEPVVAPVQETAAVSPTFDDSVVAALADVKGTEKSAGASREKTDPAFQNHLDSFFDLPSDPEYADDEEPLLADNEARTVESGGTGALFDDSAELTLDAEEETAEGELLSSASAFDETVDVAAPADDAGELTLESDAPGSDEALETAGGDELFASTLDETVDVAAPVEESAELTFEPDAPGSDEALGTAGGDELFASTLDETVDVAAPADDAAELTFESDAPGSDEALETAGGDELFASTLDETMDVAAPVDDAAELTFEPDALGSDEAPEAGGDELFSSAFDETVDVAASTEEEVGADIAMSEELFAENPEPGLVAEDVSADGDELFASAPEEATEEPLAEDELFGPSGDDDVMLTLDAEGADDIQVDSLADALSGEDDGDAAIAALSLETPKTPAPGLDELAESGEARDFLQGGHDIEEIPDEELAFTEEEKAPDAAAEQILADDVLLQPEDSLSESVSPEVETPDKQSLASDDLFADDDESLAPAAEEAPGELFAGMESPAVESATEAPGELFADMESPAAENAAEESGELFADMESPAAENKAEEFGDQFAAADDVAAPAAVAEMGPSFGEALGRGINALGAALPTLLTQFSNEHLGQTRQQLRELRESEALSPVQTAAAGMLDTVLSGLSGRAGRAESGDTAAVVESLYNSLAEPKDHLSLETVTAYTQWVQTLIAGQAEPQESAAPLSAGELHRELDEFRSSIREELAQIREALQKH